ncbi:MULTISPECIES: CheR family methyltransferase [unclassified Rhizobium]|uniref:CheR family methyltransferase n=1 Tax=unclassified Rhizobium TaxID=2613769 RepID=UPI0009EB159E|nr:MULTISPECIES: CheR family methyltransferase [unclassified Rhizobium]
MGSSAGGLEACRRFLSVVPADCRMAFILVQHLDPFHKSMMVDLLAKDTKILVCEASDGMVVMPGHVYVIPPSSYIALDAGVLRVTKPEIAHGRQFAIDYLFRSLALFLKEKAMVVVLSGSGSDGTLGSVEVRNAGGLVIAQDLQEAGHDGMPRSVVAAGANDSLLRAAAMPEALRAHASGERVLGMENSRPDSTKTSQTISQIIQLLIDETHSDFSLYKHGTLERRIQRRMAMRSIGNGDMRQYLGVLRQDAHERSQLAKDLLIHVTAFFRDAQVFERIANDVFPALLDNKKPDQTLRIWVAGCSTGEEAYSFAMLFREYADSKKLSIKLQIFASDNDADAIAVAREALYPASALEDVSSERLNRFFVREEDGYRVAPDLRGLIVFALHNILADPPFSNIDIISCRNVLIYLEGEAQSKTMALFHFALRDNGILVLGSAETAGRPGDYFDPLLKGERIYRRTSPRRRSEVNFALGSGPFLRSLAPNTQSYLYSRQAALGDLCRRIVLANHSPAAILINSRNESIYSLGPVGRYMQVSAGIPSHDVFSMLPRVLHNDLRSAIRQAHREKKRVVARGGRVSDATGLLRFDMHVEHVDYGGEEFVLVCFIDVRRQKSGSDKTVTPADVSRVGELQRELDEVRGELNSAIRDLEIAGEEQRAMYEEALSLNEEFQSANEELVTSKEELQSLNEELTVLNGQLQETLERQNATANDLENVLYIADVATLFLDNALNIRFFTPAIRSVFSILGSDIGRPLADLSPKMDDADLFQDIARVLQTGDTAEREVLAHGGEWYIRRVMQYRTLEGGADGVVILFVESTHQRLAADALMAARRDADAANLSKSRFLAAASHDLRQPLQTLKLIQGLLETSKEGDGRKRLVEKLGSTIASMSGTLSTMLGINQIEAGVVKPHKESFPIGGLLKRLGEEFSVSSEVQAVRLRVVPSSFIVHTDPRLLEQMLRNLVSNSLKYTRMGRILVGCRRAGDRVFVQIRDTGIGISPRALATIFDEYNQVVPADGVHQHGLGLGLSIVKRLGDLLEHRIEVRSKIGAGSLFSVEIPLAYAGPTTVLPLPSREAAKGSAAKAVVLIIEDDNDVRDLLRVALLQEGHQVWTASHAEEALSILSTETMPDVIIADFNLAHRLTGLQAVVAIREMLARDIPAIILTGDISTDTLRTISDHKLQILFKPVRTSDLNRAIQEILSQHSPEGTHGSNIRKAAADGECTLYLVDDDDEIRGNLRTFFEGEGWIVWDYSSCEAFLADYTPNQDACLLIDAYLPGMKGLDLLTVMEDAGLQIPTVMITGHSDVEIAVQAMKAGASDFMEKPVGLAQLLVSVTAAVSQFRRARKSTAAGDVARITIEALTSRQRQIMEMVVSGRSNKVIAAELGISQRTVENHRAAIMRKTNSNSLAALARLVAAMGN